MTRPHLLPMPWLSSFLLLALLIVAIGCGKDEEPAPSSPTSSAKTESPPPRPDLTVADLEPRIVEAGAERAVPTRIVVQFARPVVDESKVGPAGSGTVLRIEPPVAGELRFTSPSVLTFTAKTAFAPSTDYTVELTSVEAYSGTLQSPAPKRWSRVFRTPDFAFLRASLGRIDFEHQRAEVDLEFSAPVAPGEVERRARFWVVEPGGRQSTPTVRIAAGDEPSTVRAIVVASELKAGSRVEVRLEGGVPSVASPQLRAGSAAASVALAAGASVEVLASYRGEAASGFYVQVVCNDTSIETRRGYWDRIKQEYFEVSTRCEPDELAAGAIHFDPPVPISVSPSQGGFRIFGDFARGNYKMRLDAGLRTVDGGMLHEAYELAFDVPARSPQLRFVSKGRYLAREAWRSLPLRHLNLERATLTVRHVPPENLVFWMSDDSDERATDRNSNLLLTRELALPGKADDELTTYVDLASLVPADTKGMLELTVANGNTRDTARLLLTDLHLVAKRAGQLPEEKWSRDVQVWALDAVSTEPVRGVEVRLVRKSGFAIASCRTGGDGGCRLAAPSQDAVDPSPPFALVASRGNDLTYLRFQDLKTEVQEAQIAGEPYRGEQKYRAAVYGARGVYRPGETAHFAAIVRGENDVAPPAGMPVLADVVDPRGRTLRRAALATNPAGWVNLDTEFPAFAATGRYELRLEAGERKIGQHRFQVEEFVPERMKVEATSADPHYLLGEEMQIAVSARYLFGGVPAEHKVELGCDLEPSIFAPKQNASYHYGVWQPEDKPLRPLSLGTVESELDTAGEATLACPGGGRAGGFRGPAKLVARAAVFESGSGRTSVGTTEVPVHPERFYLGLQTGTKKLAAGDELVVEGVVVDWQGALVKDVAQVELQFVRLEWEWGWYFDESLGYESYTRYQRPTVGERQTAAVSGGKFKASWKPSDNAPGFIVRAAAGDARTDLEIEGKDDWYWWAPEESQVDATPKPGRPAWIALSVPETIEVGKPFPVRFNVPYKGRVLLTLETDQLVASKWLDVGPGDAVWMAELEKFVPNVYATAFLVKDPSLQGPGAFLPDRAFGVQSVRVQPAAFTHKLALEVPKEVRSSSKLSIGLDLGKLDGPTFATVAAVDEGILSLTRFKSPNPFDDVFARRALGVETFETVGWSLLIPPGAPSSVAGGDTEGGLGRVQPIKPVALWSGVLEVPSSGRLTVEFELPSYRGELRVMAVTAGPKKMGHADAQVVVRDPLVVQSTLPRFLTRDDLARVPVAVTNLSGQNRQVTVTLGVENLPVPGLEPKGTAAVEIVGPAQQTLELADGASGTVTFETRALEASGAVTMEVVAAAGELKSTETTDVPLLPAGPKSRRVQRLELAAGKLDLAPHLEGWVPLTERSTFWVTSNPYADVFDHLKHLVRYPYGCLEQTTSTARPLLYLAQMLPSIDPSLVDPEGVDKLVSYGIERIVSMQTAEGGFAYWPGGGEPAFWATAYATHFLLDAQALRYPVSQEAIDEAVSWMERQVTSYYPASHDDWYSKNAEPYMHYVLARAGKGQKGRIETLLSQLGKGQDGEEKEMVFLLQAALHLAGDHRYEQALRNPDLTDVTPMRRNSWSFYSDRRRRGMMLAILTDVFGREKSLEPLANLVAEALRGHPSGWYTTQELVWGISGLGKWVEEGAKQFDPPVLTAGGKTIAPAAVPAGRKTSDRTWNLARASEYDSLTLEIKGKGEGKLYLILSSEGVRTEPDWRTGGEGLRLQRRYLDALGTPLDPAADLALGDLVYVELTLTNTTGEKASNLALVDRIPAGWEIENPRLGRGSAIDWLEEDELWQADHLDLRDDRIEIFGQLEKGESRKVVYAARAVAAGRFAVPPVEAEAMYDPRIWARETGQRLTIAGPEGE